MSSQGGKSVSMSRINDVVQIALICRQHRAMLFAEMPNRDKLFYFPFAVLKPGESAFKVQNAKQEAILAALSLNKANLSNAILVDLLRIEVPPSNESVMRYTFRLEGKRESICVCNQLDSSSDDFVWLQYEKDSPRSFTHARKLWAVEPTLMLDKILNSPNPTEDVLQEIKCFTDEMKVANNPLSKLMAELKYDKEVLYGVFVEYLDHTYPSIYMNRTAFKNFFSKHSSLCGEYEKKLLLAAFQIAPKMDASLGIYIGFDEFIRGLLFIDCRCPHQPPYEDIRASYIFRYYSENKQTLEYDDLAAMAAECKQDTYSGQGGSIDEEVKAFWDMATSRRVADETRTGLTCSEFQATAHTMAPRYRKYLDLDKILRGSKALRAALDISPKSFSREKKAEHTAEASYDGSISEVLDSEMWIPELKREKLIATLKREKWIPKLEPQSKLPPSGSENKEDSKDTTNKMNDLDDFPDILYEAIANHLEAIKQTPTEDNSSDKWSDSFFQKYHDKFYDILAAVEETVGDTVVKLQSPVAVIKVLRTTKLLAIERNIAQLQMSPIRYLYMLHWDEFFEKGLEYILLLVALKALQPYRIHLVISNYDSIKREHARDWLVDQFNYYVQSNTKSRHLVTALMRLLSKLPQCALIDDAVYVVPGVEYLGKVPVNLRRLLASCEGPASEKSIARASKRSVKDDGRKKSSRISFTAKAMGLYQRPQVKPQPSDACYVLFTTTAPMDAKMYLRNPDEPNAAPIALGTGDTMPGQAKDVERDLVVVVDANKIRPLFLLTKAQRKIDTKYQ